MAFTAWRNFTWVILVTSSALLFGWWVILTTRRVFWGGFLLDVWFTVNVGASAVVVLVNCPFVASNALEILTNHVVFLPVILNCGNLFFVLVSLLARRLASAILLSLVHAHFQLLLFPVPWILWYHYHVINYFVLYSAIFTSCWWRVSNIHFIYLIAFFALPVSFFQRCSLLLIWLFFRGACFDFLVC